MFYFMFVYHLESDVKLDAQEKLFLQTTFSGFIGLCRLDKNLTGPGPEISIHLGVTLFLSFFVTFFLLQPHALQETALL